MARQRAVQALYQWQQAGHDLSEIDAQFLAGQDMSRVEVPYFQELLYKIPKDIENLDAYLEPLLNRKINEVDSVERAILRIGTYELKHRLDVPYRVVINEGIVLAKKFGAVDSHRFVNGILDKLSFTLRSAERK
ncbi:Transcription termination protein NusB [hydrothermal vent metagenome]|uniref:Transcription termination protein NusB n=1 Tax=hydrothermal vent metagenome TaxID=652676 RepID=A0A3B0ZN97_9ZZZZ